MTASKLEKSYCRIKSVTGFGCALLAALLFVGCGDGEDTYLDGGTSPDGGGAATGLPCDVQTLLQTYCLACHGQPPAGAPMALVSYQDLVMPSFVDAKQKVAERALARMQDTMNPMPPGPTPTVPANAIAAFQKWVTAGTPAGTCMTMPMSVDPLNAAPQCTSGKTWMDSNGSAMMNPGKACISCHAMNKGPKLQIAGTVYPSGHEPDLCLGAPSTGDITVEITGADGKVVSLPVNGNGNFLSMSRTAIKLPYHAKVKQGTKERAMSAAQMSGDCNSCHTQSGQNGAPGRITLPQ